MHAMEWIQQNGRYLRKLGAAYLRAKLAREKGHCTWCDGPVAPNRRRWCSAECVHEFRVRCDTNYIVWQLRKRDGGVCRVCRRKTVWQADHIIPIEEGGGLCDLTGYQTLCEKCHQDKTASQARDRAQRRRQEKYEWSPQLELFAVTSQEG